jgi:hypothetical protein
MASTFTFLPVGVDEVATERSPWRIIFLGRISTTRATRLAPTGNQDFLLLFIRYLQNSTIKRATIASFGD